MQVNVIEEKLETALRFFARIYGGKVTGRAAPVSKAGIKAADVDMSQ